MTGYQSKKAAAQDKLAQLAQEPVATIHDLRNSLMYTLEANGYSRNDNLYTTPPQRPWVGLTDQEAQLIYDMGRTPTGMMEMVEAMLKEKNNG